MGRGHGAGPGWRDGQAGGTLGRRSRAAQAPSHSTGDTHCFSLTPGLAHSIPPRWPQAGVEGGACLTLQDTPDVPAGPGAFALGWLLGMKPPIFRGSVVQGSIYFLTERQNTKAPARDVHLVSRCRMKPRIACRKMYQVEVFFPPVIGKLWCKTRLFYYKPFCLGG